MIQKKGTNKYKKKSAKPSYSGKASAGKRPKTAPHTSRVRQRNSRIIIACLAVLLILFIIGTVALRVAREREQQQREAVLKNAQGGPEVWQQQGAPYIDVELLTPNAYSRPQLAIDKVNYIAIHYTANPGAGAMANRNYFENLAVTQQTKVSSHFVIGLEGEVVQCIPTSEISYATNERNVDTVSIECCHPDETGLFNDATYDSVVKLTAWLCTRFGLTEENVIRHYDVTGKNCPKYYVENPEAWTKMKEDIAHRIQEDYVLQENLS